MLSSENIVPSLLYEIRGWRSQWEWYYCPLILTCFQASVEPPIVDPEG